jgi:hypothetical protein
MYGNQSERKFKLKKAKETEVTGKRVFTYVLMSLLALIFFKSVI